MKNHEPFKKIIASIKQLYHMLTHNQQLLYMNHTAINLLLNSNLLLLLLSFDLERLLMRLLRDFSREPDFDRRRFVL